MKEIMMVIMMVMGMGFDQNEVNQVNTAHFVRVLLIKELIILGIPMIDMFLIV